MKYNITENNLIQIFQKLERVIEENNGTINELFKIDSKYCKMRVNINTLKKVLNRLKTQKIDKQIEQKIMIKYNGNPYITLNLCILAILTKTTIILDSKENMLGINTFIVKAVNDILNELKTEKMIYIKQGEQENDVDKIICIDDINQYNTYVLEKNQKARFYSLNYINFYCDTEELEELSELIFKYAEENKIPIEVYSELENNEAIQMMKAGIGKVTIILTKNEETKEYAKKEIKNKKLYINENPFQKEEEIIKKEIFYI